MAAAVARRGSFPGADRQRRRMLPLAGLAAAVALHLAALLVLVPLRPFEPAPPGEAPITVEIAVDSPRRLLAPAPAPSPSPPPPSAIVAQAAPAPAPSVVSVPAPPATGSPSPPPATPSPAASQTLAIAPSPPPAPRITAAASSIPGPAATVAASAPAQVTAAPSGPLAVGSTSAVPVTPALVSTAAVPTQAPSPAVVARASTALATVAAIVGTSVASKAVTLEAARQPEEPLAVTGHSSASILASAAVAPEQASAASTPSLALAPDASAVLPITPAATLLRPLGPEPATPVATSVLVIGARAAITPAPPPIPILLTPKAQPQSSRDQAAAAAAAIAGVAVVAPRSPPAAPAPAAQPAAQTEVVSPRPLASPSQAEVPQPAQRPEAPLANAGPPPVSPSSATRVTATVAGSVTRPPEKAAAVPVAALPARALDVDALRERAAGALPCSRLEVGLREDLGVTVMGRVASPGDRGRLAVILDAMLPAGTVADLDVEVVGAPFCAALDVVEAAATADAAAPPRTGLNRADGVYRDGDYLVATVEVPGDADGHHLHVAFLDHAGKVVHLLPNPTARETRVAAGQRVRLGVEAPERRAGVRDYRVTPPFGPGMILAVLSERPLLGVGAAEVEPLADFLASLAAALAGPPLGSVRFARVGLETRP